MSAFPWSVLEGSVKSPIPIRVLHHALKPTSLISHSSTSSHPPLKLALSPLKLSILISSFVLGAYGRSERAEFESWGGGGRGRGGRVGGVDRVVGH